MPENLVARREAERALLGAILIQSACHDGNAITEVKKILASTDFMDSTSYQGQHARIYEAMTHLEYPHEVNVAEELNNTGKLVTGDCGYLTQLVADCPCSVAYKDFVETILRYSTGKKKPQFKDGI